VRVTHSKQQIKEMITSSKHSPLASIHESYEIKAKGRSSDLLPEILPSPSLSDKWLDLNSVTELTAAGQLWIYTIFPFNPNQI